MVVWEAGGMKKDDYKRFKIRTVPGADDFAMMAEVLRRRYGKALEDGGTLPDLILLDGGRGQLNAGSRVLEELGLDYLPIVALAKRAEEVYHPGSLHPLVLDLASPALQTLQRIRDEAHRFAITYHKKLRQKRTLGLGPRPDPGRGPVDPDEPPQVARLGAPGADRLRRGARRGAQGHPEARAAHPRLLPSGTGGADGDAAAPRPAPPGAPTPCIGG